MVPVSEITHALNAPVAPDGPDEHDLDDPPPLLPQAAASRASKLSAATAGTVCRTDYLLFRGGCRRLFREGCHRPRVLPVAPSARSAAGLADPTAPLWDVRRLDLPGRPGKVTEGGAGWPLPNRNQATRRRPGSPAGPGPASFILKR